MLKKNAPISFKIPQSTMSLVYQAIREGHRSPEKIRAVTGKTPSQVRSALYNLSFVGMIVPARIDGKTRWVTVAEADSAEDDPVNIYSNCSSIFCVTIHQ